MKKALPMWCILLLLSLSISVEFLFPSIGETVIDERSFLWFSERETGVSVLAEAAPEAPEAPKPPQSSPAENAQRAVTPTGAQETTLPGEVPAPGVEAGQPQPQPQPQPMPVSPGAPKRNPSLRQPSQEGGAPVSFFFDDADIYEVIQTVFGDVLKVNYVIDPKVKGRITFRTVTPIPKSEVLSVMEIILRINGVGYVEEKGLYRIIGLNDVPTELVYSQVGKEPSKVAIELFTFKNMNLKDSMTDIQNVIGLNVKGGTMRIIPIQRLNALIVVTSSKEQMDYARKWVEEFDAMFANARPKIHVYPLQNSKAEHVSQMLMSVLGTGGGAIGGGAAAAAPTAAKAATSTGATTPTSTTGTQAQSIPPTPKPGPSPGTGGGGGGTGTGFLVSPDTKIFADETTNSLIIVAIPADYAFIEETIKQLDSVPRQVVIEGLLVRVDITDNMDFGMQWSIQNNLAIQGFTKNPITISGPLTLNSLITADAIANPAMFQFTALDPSGNVKLALQSLATLGKAKVLASPQILVSDNQEAHIQVGQQIPLATSTTTEPLATTTTTTSLASTSTIQYKDIGIILKVKPQINDSGVVALSVSQEVSSVGANVDIAGQAFASINKTEVETQLVAKDGETIIMGGLIEDNISNSRSGIPILSRIPILGYLFGSTNDDTTRTELIILLTPHVAKNLSGASKVTSEYLDQYKKMTNDKGIMQFIEERSQKGQKEKNGDAGAGEVK